MKNKIDKKLKKNFRLLLLTSILSGVSATGFAATITCTPEADGSYMPGDYAPLPSCNNVVAATVTQSGNAEWYIMTRSRLHETLYVGDSNVTANVNGGYGGIVNQYAYGLSGAAIIAGNLTFKVTGNGNINGLGTHSNVNMTTKNVILNLTDNYTAGSNNSGYVAQYGVLTGSTVDSGERATYNGQYSTITTENLTINQTATGGWLNPILNNGIRAIQGANQNLGNGSAGQVIVNGNLDMTLTGNRSIGIYVSGNQSNHGDATAAGSNGALTPKVILNNDATITINKGTDSSFSVWDSHGIKLGKVRYAGEGAGILESHGNLKIDTTNALQGGGIKMMRNSIFDASDSKSSTEVKTNGYALEIGGHDDQARNGSTTTFELPAFCNYAAKLCDWLDWTQEDKELEEAEKEEPEELDLGTIDKNRFRANGQCPAPIQVNESVRALGKSVDFDLTIEWTQICNVAEDTSPLVLLISTITGLLILVGGGRSSEP